MQQLSLEGAIPRHYNQSLFADYYLDHRLDEHAAWLEADAQAKTLRDSLRALRGDQNLAALSESQLEEQWIRPVLRALGHYYGVQINIRYRERGIRTPDYLLMATEADQQALGKQVYAPNDIRHALAVVDAKQMGIPLDRLSEDTRNPSQQIDEYLRYSELAWGVLTDGRWWRIYKRESSKYNHFYAVDLLELLDHPEADFRYFYAFFRREAFAEGGFLAQVSRESVLYAEQLSDKLETQVFSALEAVAQGFLDYRLNDLAEALEDFPIETLQTLYSQSLVLLYRLMFLFYAESRAILPINESNPYFNMGYRKNSLQQMVHKVANSIDAGELGDVLKAGRYQDLLDLFNWIDKGYERVGLLPYNGRLFSNENYPFLARNKVGEYYMNHALDLLARVPHPTDPRQRVMVDYRDLDVRHLGSIYEKLLDFELDVAAENLMLDGDQYQPFNGVGQPFKRKGEVYLRAVDSANNERKATGSYYTPDYITRFIIDRSLRPLLEEIVGQYATFDEQDGWKIPADTNVHALREAILAINILDPAIGSGHFLVDVTAYLAEWLRDLHIAPIDHESAEDELLYWKRQVVTNCIYGVDINPLAVELAKLALWLVTVGRGKPLSFLDHHLRVGNSLVGVRFAELGVKWDLPRPTRSKKAVAQAQIPLIEDDQSFTVDVGHSVNFIHEIEAIIPDSIDDVKDQERLYKDMAEQLAPYRQLADIWTSRYFGFTSGQFEWDTIRAYVMHHNAASNDEDAEAAAGTAIINGNKRILDAVATADRLAKEHHFFHWDLMFPEIFFTPDGKPKPDAGFDVVVGNPPYVRQERIKAIKSFLETRYQVYSGTADLFLYFYELGLRFLKPQRRLGFVTSGTFMNSNSATKFRELLPQQGRFEVTFNFGENQPFRRAEIVYPTISIIRKGDQSPTFRSYFMEGAHRPLELGDVMDQVIAEGSIEVASETLAMPEWRFQRRELTDLFKKLNSIAATNLNDLIGGRIYRGVTTGLNEVFVIDETQRNELINRDSSSATLIKPMIRGEDLRPWYSEYENLYLVFSRRGIQLEEYPAIQAYLTEHRTRLEPKPSDLPSGKQWKGRKAGDYQWFEIQDQTEYYHEFEIPKIYWAEISKLPRFSWDDQGMYATNKAHFLIPPSMSLLAILNSRCTWYSISQLCVPLRLRAGLWQYQLTQQFITRLPIPPLTGEQDRELAALAQQITELAKTRYRLHESLRQNLQSDFGSSDQKLNTAATAWYELADFDALNAEVEKSFGSPIPLKRRDEWRGYFAEQLADHQRLTAAIISAETRLNTIVYAAFKLTAEEIALIEAETKYPYGSV